MGYRNNFAFYNIIWKTEIAKLSKAESYLLYKGDIRLENYPFKIKNIKHRKALTRLRLSCHPLMRKTSNEPIENVHFVNL